MNTVKYLGGKLIKLDDNDDSNDTAGKDKIKKNNYEKEFKTEINVKSLDELNNEQIISETENKEISTTKKENKSKKSKTS